MEQIIRFVWKKWKPMLVLRSLPVNNAIREREIDLFSDGIDIEINELRCIGFKKNGKHFPCPGNRKLESGTQCKSCMQNDAFFRCVRCNGDSCINPEQRASCMKNNYYIYLAAFGNILKVGLTHEQRSLQRFVEQGADFAVRIAHIRDGKIARKTEQYIKKLVGATDRVKGEQKFKQLFEDPGNAVKNIHDAIELMQKKNVNHLIKPTIEDLRSFYRLEQIKMRPEEIAVENGVRLNGRVAACKGNLLFVENDKGFHAVNAHRLVGRVLAD